MLALLLTIAGAVGFAAAGLSLVRWLIRRGAGLGHNEMSSSIFSVGGTISAVFLAFVVVAAWEAHDDAEADVAEEASLLATLYRASTAMDRESGDRLRALVREYTHAVIDDEWKVQVRGGAAESARRAGLEMFRLFAAQPAGVRRDDAVIDAAQLALLAQIQAARNKRTLISQQGLSPLIWWTAVVNGVLVVVMSFFLYPDRLGTHLVMSAALAVMIAILLYVISLFSRPFAGLTPLQPDAFVHSLEVYDSVDGTL